MSVTSERQPFILVYLKSFLSVNNDHKVSKVQSIVEKQFKLFNLIEMAFVLKVC